MKKVSGHIATDDCCFCKTHCGHAYRGIQKSYGIEAPSFSAEQLKYLRSILIPPCCHVSGMHEPTHFKEDQYVCEHQKAKGFDNAWKILFGTEIRSTDIPPRKNCGWCNGEWGSEKHLLSQIIRKTWEEIHPSRVCQFPDAQLFEGKWYIGKWGCDTLQHMADIFNER